LKELKEIFYKKSEREKDRPMPDATPESLTRKRLRLLNATKDAFECICKHFKKGTFCLVQ